VSEQAAPVSSLQEKVPDSFSQLMKLNLEPLCRVSVAPGLLALQKFGGTRVRVDFPFIVHYALRGLLARSSDGKQGSESTFSSDAQQN